MGVMWGFLALFLGTVGRSFNTYVVHLLSGNFYLIYSFLLDMAGLALLVGVVYGLIRRYLWKPERMATSIRDGFFLLLLLVIILSGFAMEGTRIVVLNPPAIDWSPVGYVFGSVARAVTGGHEAALVVIYQLLWMFHALFVLFFIAYIPFSKGVHIFASQITTSVAAERKRQSRA